MTYDPNRDTRIPGDMNPRARRYDRMRSNSGLGLLLGLIALLLIGGFLFYNMGDRDNVASNSRPAATATTGSGAPAPAVRDRGTGTNVPAANTPTTPATKQ